MLLIGGEMKIKKYTIISYFLCRLYLLRSFMPKSAILKQNMRK